jgi:hypothetical protein
MSMVTVRMIRLGSSLSPFYFYLSLLTLQKAQAATTSGVCLHLLRRNGCLGEQDGNRDFFKKRMFENIRFQVSTKKKLEKIGKKIGTYVLGGGDTDYFECRRRTFVITITHSPFTLANLSSVNLVSIFRFPVPRTTQCIRDV